MKIAMLTGWTYAEIDSLGIQERSDVLQVYEAELKLTVPTKSKK